MKRIIAGKTYNIDTATLVAMGSWDNEGRSDRGSRPLSHAGWGVFQRHQHYGASP
jgi:hypothetical protein